MVFHWSLSDIKSLQVSRTLLSILADLNYIVVWMVSIHPLVTMSSSLYSNLLVTVPSAWIRIGITVIFMFHCFYSSLVRFKYLSFFSFSFCLTLWLDGTTGSLFCWLSHRISRDYHFFFHYYNLCKFFISLLSDSFSLLSKWQQVSSGLQDFWKYSSLS